MELTAINFRQKFLYCPDTGLIFNRLSPGIPIGHFNYNGYIYVSLSRRRYRAHRLAWLYMTGEWPARDIDHINCVRSDNRWANLRLATRANNSWNRKLSSKNTSGVKGVCLCNGKWAIRMHYEGKRIYLGSFSDLDLAELIAAEWRAKFHGEFAKV